MRRVNSVTSFCQTSIALPVFLDRVRAGSLAVARSCAACFRGSELAPGRRWSLLAGVADQASAMSGLCLSRPGSGEVAQSAQAGQKEIRAAAHGDELRYARKTASQAAVHRQGEPRGRGAAGQRLALAE
jgi:hypothetical protein